MAESERANFLLAARAKIRLSFVSTTAVVAVVVASCRVTHEAVKSESGFISCFELPLPSPRRPTSRERELLFTRRGVLRSRERACMHERVKPIICVGFWVDC